MKRTVKYADDFKVNGVKPTPDSKPLRMRKGTKREWSLIRKFLDNVRSNNSHKENNGDGEKD